MGELSDMFPGPAYFEVDPTLEVMFAPNKEPQPLPDSGLVDTSVPSMPSILPNTVATMNYSQEKSMSFNLSKQEISCTPTLGVQKEKEAVKRPQSNSSTTRTASKRKKNCQTKSENNAQPSFRQNRNVKPQPPRFPFNPAEHSSLPIAPASSLQPFCPLAPSPSVTSVAPTTAAPPGTPKPSNTGHRWTFTLAAITPWRTCSTSASGASSSLTKATCPSANPSKNSSITATSTPPTARKCPSPRAM